MSNSYYREKLIKLFEKIYAGSGDARSRIINCEDHIFTAYIASRNDEIPVEVKLKWDKLWNDLNQEPEWRTKDGQVIMTSLRKTVLKKRNRTMRNYLAFFLEEFYRVID